MPSTRARSWADALTRLWADAGPQTLAAAAAAAALLALVLPVPAAIVDLLLALSLGAAAGVLLVALISEDPPSISSLPPVLVLASLARIVLCLCLSRLILVTSAAGGLAPALGDLVGGADALAGVGVLIVLAVVQLVMVTAGVGRTAEVAARFALDALPGKQMGLDTALSQGHISASEAQSQVQRLEQEANFYGAMDGASRFLRGEAVATAVIVSLTGLGAALRAFGAGGGAEAARQYAVMVTGQGLVTILPALLMGAAAAVIVSRAASGSDLMDALGSQALLTPWPLVAGAVVLLSLGLVPGVAKVPTLLAGTALVVGAWWLSRRPAASRGDRARRPRAHPGERAQPPADAEFTVELGLGLLGLLEGPEDLTELLPELRAEMSEALGFQLPALTVRDSVELRATEYAFVFRAGTLSRGTVRPQRVLAVAPRASVTPDVGTPAELADGRTGVWVTPAEAEPLSQQGYALLSPAEALLQHLRVVLCRHAAGLFDLERATELLREIEAGHPAATAEGQAAGLTPALMAQVVRELLRAGIPLRDPLSVFEETVESLPEETDPEALALRVGPRLAGMISDYLARDGRVPAVALAPELEDELAEAALRRSGHTVAALPPGRAGAWLQALDHAGQEYGWGRPLAIICEPRCLPALRSLCAETQAQLIALQPAELADSVQIEFVTRLTAEQIAAAGA